MEGSSLEHKKDNAWLGAAIAVQNNGDRMVVSELSAGLACTEITVIIAGFKLKAVHAERRVRKRERYFRGYKISIRLSGFDQMIACWFSTACRVVSFFPEISEDAFIFMLSDFG